MQDGLNRKLELLCRISEEEHSLGEIADLAHDLFGNPIHITDMSRTVLAYTHSAEISNEFWLRDVVNDEGVQETLAQAREVRQIHNESIRTRMPLYVDDSVVPFPLYIKTLLNDDKKPVGVVILSGINHPLTPLDGQLLELLSGSLVRQMERERFVLRASEKQADNFVIKLLDGVVESERQVQTWLNYLNWHPKDIRYAVVFQADGTDTNAEPMENVLNELRAIPHSRAVLYEGRAVLILSREKPVASWYEDERILIQKADQWGMVLGISREIPKLCNLQSAYEEAKTALRIGQSMGNSETVYEYIRYSFYHLVETLPKGVDVRGFCDDRVLRLERMDKSPSKELMTTLLHYLNNSRSLTKTAETMYIHRNTVRYRINRCMQIMQTNLEDGNEIFDVIFSLRLLKNLHLFE